jgi:ribonucleoside-triphosphate reductase
MPVVQEEEKPAVATDATYLITTATCPNCKIACALLDKAGVVYDKLLANDVPEIVREYGIKQAPTLIVIRGGVQEKYVGVSEIKKFLNA